jgi:ligand-binding sensor domain-containing protein/signal transduction histidine kinase
LSLIQTRDGYLWLGTEEGLVRFDGVSFTLFDRTNTGEIKHNYISSLCEDREGGLWFGTQGGVNRYKDGKFTVYTTKDGLSDDFVRSIYADAEGGIWVGTQAGLNRYKDGRFTVYTTKDGLSNDNVTSIREDRDGGLWLGTRNGLNRYKDGKFTVYTTKDGLSDDFVRSIYQDREGMVWVGTQAGLNRYKDGKFTVYTTKEGLSNDNVRALYEDRQGNLWVGTRAGFNRWSGGRFTALTTKDGWTNDFVLSICEDNEGGLWVGTTDGLNRFKDGSFYAITTREGLSHDGVRTLYEDSKGNIWIGTDDGLNRYKDGKVTVFTTKDGLSNDNISSIHEDAEGTLWIGTNGGGVNSYKGGKFTAVITKDIPPKADVTSVYLGRDGSLWIAVWVTGLNRFKDGRWTHFTTSDGLASNNIRSLYEDVSGDLWIGTMQGLSRFKDGNFTTFTTHNGLSGDAITCTYEDKEGSLWIGTSGFGLTRLKDGRFTNFTVGQGLFDDIAYTILEDDQDNLWMSCNKGIYRVSKKDLANADEGNVRLPPPITYGVGDGLKSNECTSGSPGGLRASDGRLWFTTTRGAAVINPKEVSVNTLPPPVVVEKVVINGKDVDNSSGTLEVPPGATALEIHFTALSLLAPEKVRFKYKLEGFDGDWIDPATRRVAYYNNLRPGVYRFKVIACNNDGFWNESGASFEFVMLPHFYQTAWFYAICSVALILLCFGLYRLRIRQLRRQNLVLEEIVDRRTLELKQSQSKVLELEREATEQQMAGGFAHEMRNALTGPKLLLDRALAIDGIKPHPSSCLANCHALKKIFKSMKDCLSEGQLQNVMAEMQVIFANEERLDETLKLVHRAVGRGLNITQQIMDYARLGQQMPGHSTVNLDTLVTGIIEESREEFLGQGIVMEYKASGQPAYALGDETQFYRVVKNLILNARDALTDPSVKENIRRIVVTAVREGTNCVLGVADNGVGIPAENMQKVFEPFFSTKPATGTGLGLGMVKKIISLYGGTIEVRSEVGRGTVFTILLPHPDTGIPPFHRPRLTEISHGIDRLKKHASFEAQGAKNPSDVREPSSGSPKTILLAS